MRRLFLGISLATLVLVGCGGGGGSSSGSALPGGVTTPATAAAVPTATATTVAASPSPSPTAASMLSAYQGAQWQNGTTVSFSGSCSMTITTTGAPASHNDYYLAPASSGQPIYAYTAVTKMAMTVISARLTNLQTLNQTFNICPSKATTATTTSGGEIGIMLTGEVLYNPYEISQTTTALSDNASYSGSATNGETAYFIDSCNSHSTTLSSNGAVQWHFHGVPSCITSSVDGASGPSHIIGIALDGYPIYGGRDINGNVISVSQLDACNGITSPTPEFPNGIYHYVLPIGVTTAQSSIGCFTGNVPHSLLAQSVEPYCGFNDLNSTQQAQAIAAIRRNLDLLLRRKS